MEMLHLQITEHLFYFSGSWQLHVWYCLFAWSRCEEGKFTIILWWSISSPLIYNCSCFHRASIHSGTLMCCF